MPTATGEFELQSWTEDTYRELAGGGKLTRAMFKQAFTGDVAGSGEVEWLMCYLEDGTARFVGLQRIEGSVQDRDGSFVLECVGEFDGGKARGTWSVVRGSGTDALAGLHGEGSFEAPRGPKASWVLEYGLE